MARAFLVWILGLVTLVPYAGWYLLFEAEHGQYPLLITFIIAWIIGYHGVVLPLIAAWRVRKFFRFLEGLASGDAVPAAFNDPETRKAFILNLARENGVPLFVARCVFARFEQGLPRQETPAEGA